MMYAQAQRYVEEFRGAGFEGVGFGGATYQGYVVFGFAVVGGVRTRFEIRSPRMAEQFKRDYGKREVPNVCVA